MLEARVPTWGERRLFFAATGVVVTGYVLWGRPFAWLHVPGIPLFPGEVTAAAALLVLARRRRQDRVRLPRYWSVALVLLTYAALRLSWDVWSYGLGAVRDAAMLGYAIVGWAAFRLVPECDTEARQTATRWVSRVAVAVILWAPVAIVVAKTLGPRAPLIPDSETSALGFKGGDLSVYVGAAMAWLILIPEMISPMKARWSLTAGGVGLLILGTQNRGGLLAALATLLLVLLAVSKRERRQALRQIVMPVLIALLILAVTGITIRTIRRTISFDQLVANVVSIFDPPEGSSLEGTVRWRLAYWSKVIDDIALGDDWLTGVGFGPNLADRYGFQVIGNSSQPLRNAHNSHVTLLARLGLIGAGLWLAFWGSLGLTYLDLRKDPTRRSQLWLLAFIVGVGVNSIFDPALEGPQMAIPFWLAVGVLAGLDAHHPRVRGAASARTPLQRSADTAPHQPR